MSSAAPRPVTILRLAYCGKVLAALMWLQVTSNLGDAAIVLNKNWSDSLVKNNVSAFLDRFLQLTVGIDGSRSGSLSDYLSILAYIAYSPFYPYSYILATLPSVEQGGEEQRSNVLTVFHRIAKIPLSVIPETAIDDNAPSIDLASIRDERERQKVVTAASIAFAAATAGKGRSGYMLSLSLTQTLLAYTLLSRLRPCEASVLLSAVTGFICRFYQYRMTQETGELIRHMLAARPPNLQMNWSDILTRLESHFTCNILENIYNNCSLHSLKRLARSSDKTLSQCIGRVFGRPLLIAQSIADELQDKQDGVETVVTVATEQWSLLQLLLVALATHAKRIILFYTPEVAHTVLTTHSAIGLLEGEGSISADGARLHICGRDKSISIEYILTSATDAFIVEKVVNGVISSLDKGNTLIVAQGPSTLALPLYGRARKQGYRALLL